MVPTNIGHSVLVTVLFRKCILTIILAIFRNFLMGNLLYRASSLSAPMSGSTKRGTSLYFPYIDALLIIFLN